MLKSKLKCVLLTCQVPALLEDDQTSSSSEEEEEDEEGGEGEERESEEGDDQTQQGEEAPLDKKVIKSLRIAVAVGHPAQAWRKICSFGCSPSGGATVTRVTCLFCPFWHNLLFNLGLGTCTQTPPKGFRLCLDTLTKLHCTSVWSNNIGGLPYQLQNPAFMV